MTKHHLTLSAEHEAYLGQLLATGSLPVKTFKRATALLELHRGKTFQAVAQTLGVTYETVSAWASRYRNAPPDTDALGLLTDQPRSGRPVQMHGDQEAKLTALACSQAPDGRSQWSLRLLASKAVELGYFEHLSHNHAGVILKKNELKPHLKRQWCLGKINSEYLSRMETLLHLYALPYDAHYPLVCFDERPCFLIGEVVEGLAPQPGRVAKQHYSYSKHGSCVVLAAVEPLQGQRLCTVFSQRTKKEYTQFMQRLAAAYPDALKIRLVQDNLNTHSPNAFYEHLPAEQAAALAARFEFYYTPKCGSWLNMIELEFSALARQCLNRRIPTQEQLTTQVLTWASERNEQAVKISWQFTTQHARQKLNAQYCKVNPANKKYQET